MKKIICIFISAVLLIASGCTSLNPFGSASSGSGSSSVSKIEKIDIMDKALALSDLKSFKKLKVENSRENLFAEFDKLYSNPLSVADYSLSISAELQDISDIGKNGEIIEEFITDYGFAYGKKFANIKYKTYNNIDDALTALFEVAGETEGLEKAKKDFKLVEKKVSESIALWISAAIEAYKIIKEETKDISLYEFYTCQNINFAAEDAAEQISNVKEIGKKVDLEKIISASLLVMEATEDLKQNLKLENNLTKNGKFLEVYTPIGSIYLGTNGDDVYRSPSELLIIDFNGDDKYYGRVGSNSSLSRPIAVAIDFEGNDIYDYNSYNATQGCGVFGVGMLINDFGDDQYIGKSLSQGACLYGVGVIIDTFGYDNYSSSVLSQAAGYFGIAELVDLACDDTYHSRYYSQAFAGEGAISFFVDKNGFDKYFVESSILENGEMIRNYSQGCGVGIVNPEDENEPAGAIAILLEVSGNDIYTGGSYVQGAGAYGGMGMMIDLEGSDYYVARDISQAAVSDFAIGGHIDIGGDEEYLCTSSQAQGTMGAVLNGGVALFLNYGGGDKYVTSSNALGFADSDNDYSCSFFIDTQGDDIYSYCKDGMGLGKNAFFIDGSGDDDYSFNSLKNDQGLGTEERQGGVFLDFEEKEESKEKEENDKDKKKKEYHIKFLSDINEELEERQKEKEKEKEKAK